MNVGKNIRNTPYANKRKDSRASELMVLSCQSTSWKPNVVGIELVACLSYRCQRILSGNLNGITVS